MGRQVCPDTRPLVLLLASCPHLSHGSSAAPTAIRIPTMPNASPNDGAISGSLAAGDGHAMPRKRKEQLQGKQRWRLLLAAVFCGPLAGAVVLESIAAIALA